MKKVNANKHHWILKMSEIEKRLYEIIGINTFRRLILKFEKIKHYRDKGNNLNYHLREISISSVNCFKGYLLYHVVCHVISVTFVILYFALTFILGIHNLVLDSIVGVVFLINLYCIILQRYLHIIIQAYITKKDNKRKMQANKRVDTLCQLLNKKSDNELDREFSLIQKIRGAICAGEVCFLKDTDTPILLNILECTSTLITKKNEGITTIEKRSVVPTQSIFNLQKCPLVIECVEKRVSKLQKCLHIEKSNNVLFSFCIITESTECEEIFSRLFSVSSRDSIQLFVDILYEAYTRMLLAKKRINY